MDELRALSRGIAPPILVDRGLREALAELAARSTVPAQLDAGLLGHRPEAAVETAAYFVVSEALTNVAKHSHAGRCVIGLRHDAGVLRVWVADDGVGGAAFGKGHGLRGLDDRVRAVGGATVRDPRVVTQLLWKRFARTASTNRRTRRTVGSFGVLSALLMLGLIVIVAANAHTAADPTPARLSALKDGW